MASDFTYEGEPNNSYVFRDTGFGRCGAPWPRAAGRCHAGAPRCHEVAIPNPEHPLAFLVSSIREQRERGGLAYLEAAR
jgi:hypothetical protein